jgi:hypothetical protein
MFVLAGVLENEGFYFFTFGRPVLANISSVLFPMDWNVRPEVYLQLSAAT